MRCRFRDDRTAAPCSKALVEEAMPVGGLALEREEQVALADFAGIEGDAAASRRNRPTAHRAADAQSAASPAPSLREASGSPPTRLLTPRISRAHG